MASRYRTVSFAYPRRASAVRSATRVDYRSLMLVIGLLALLAFAGVLYLSQASMAAALRFRLDGLEREAEDLWAQNLALREEIARCQRLSAIEERVGRLGMVSASLGGPYVVCALPERQAAPRAHSPRMESGAALRVSGSIWDRVLSWLRLGGAPPGQLAAATAGRP